MITVPAGEFMMGTPPEVANSLAAEHGYHPSWFAGETPQRRIYLSVFSIDLYPVTNAQYAGFVQATGHRIPATWTDGPPAGRLEHPVTGVNRADARDYAAWAGKRLPTEAEWGKAARGEDGRIFPWGDEFIPEYCCWNRSDAEGTVPVTAHPEGASPYGVMGLVGNVAEWCDDDPGPGSGFIKGGCYLTTEVVNLRPAARNMSGFDNNQSRFYGFRCAKNAD